MMTPTNSCEITVIVFITVKRKEIISSENIDLGMFPQYRRLELL